MTSAAMANLRFIALSLRPAAAVERGLQLAPPIEAKAGLDQGERDRAEALRGRAAGAEVAALLAVEGVAPRELHLDPGDVAPVAQCFGQRGAEHRAEGATSA